MKLNLSNLKNPKIYVFFVFAFLIISRGILWVSAEWPSTKKVDIEASDTVVKIHKLPIYFMVYWVDSGRYWLSSPKTFKESLSFIMHDHANRQWRLQCLFYLPIRTLTDNIAYGVLVQNMLSLLSAWMLFVMLRPHGTMFAALSILISFANLFTLSMEYALLREVLTRFLLILLLYLLWRMANSPSWGLTTAISMNLFLLPWSRSEFMIVPILIFLVILRRFSLKYILVIVLTGTLSIYTYIKNRVYSHSKYFMLHHNLLVDSYNYDSPVLKDLPKRIYDKALLCKLLYKVSPHWPSFRYSNFEAMRGEVIEEWMKENGVDNTGIDYFNVLFLDILKYNTKYVIYSANYSFWSFIIGNLSSIAPLIYSGDNPNYKFGWPYYTSPNLTHFGDPLSELKLNERGPKWIIGAITPFSEYWLRKICAPFFFIGLFCIGKMLFPSKRPISMPSSVFWLLVVLWTLSILVIMSFIGLRTSRFIFCIDPFIFTISLLGMKATSRMFVDYYRRIFSLEKAEVGNNLT